MAVLPSREFVGGPYDGLGAPVDDENVFYDTVGRAHILARFGKTLMGDYTLDLTNTPPVWRWARATDEET